MFNVVITVFFWYYLAPNIFEKLNNQQQFKTFMKIHLTTLHTLPLLFVTLNILVTKIVFLQRDYKICGFAGLIYMIFNAFGTFAIGHPLYPIATWSDIYGTVGMFIL